MFDELMESRPRRVRSTRQTALSIACHTVLIAASIQLTRAAAAPAPALVPEAEMILSRATPKPPTADDAVSTRSSAAISAAPVLSISAPIAAPVGLPPVDLGQKFDPARFSLSSRSGITNDLIGEVSDTQRVMLTSEVDVPVRLIQVSKPIYPPSLHQVGIEGNVTLRYVVDTNGVVEPKSVAVVRSTNKSFESPTIDAILTATFEPALVKKMKVRQLVEQVVRFTVRD